MTVFHTPLTPAPLTEASQTVTEFDGQIAELAEMLFAIMSENGGVALSASAIGRPERLTVVDLPDASGTWHALALVNPRITAVFDGVQDQADLFPGARSTLRFRRVDIEHETLEGETVTLAADGPLAVGLQAQIDILMGETGSTATRRLH